jgi:hypothetical protein
MLVGFEVLTAVTMKNAVFCDIKSQFVLHRRHITSPLQSPAGQCYVRFEFFTAVTMKNAIFWDVTPCGFVRTVVSEERITSIIRAECTSKLGILAVISDKPHGVTSQKMKKKIVAAIKTSNIKTKIC